MFIHDHKPALAMMVSSVISATTVATTPAVKVVLEHPSMFDVVEKWVHLFGSIAGMLAGFASATWYLYSFHKARRTK